jgi:4-oxalomesaconate tautomerase
MSADGIRCAVMRGGTSKGLLFLASDLPADPHQRDDVLLRVMGSGHPFQVDGAGGGHPLASKVGVVSRSERDDADLDYLFLQLGVADATINDRQNCGNILAAVGPFAVARGLIPAGDQEVTARIYMVNSGSVVTATFPVSAVGSSVPVLLRFADTAGSGTGSVLPTGQVRDVVDGVEVTCVDNGMPVVVARAADLGITGSESPGELESDADLIARVQALRIAAGKLMGLGDVTGLTVPKTTLVSPPQDGGSISTRTFIPVTPHTAIGVLGAVSVATALLLPGAVGAELASLPADGRIEVEHPTGKLTVDVDVDTSADPPVVRSAGVIRSARTIIDGFVYPR